MAETDYLARIAIAAEKTANNTWWTALVVWIALVGLGVAAVGWWALAVAEKASQGG